MSAQRIFERARWIWPEDPHWDLHNGYALFRHAFESKTIPERAPLHITADQSYRLYVNGRFVGRGPARGFQESWPYDEIELRPFLKRGGNQIAIRAYNPGFSNFQYLCQGFAGLLVAAHWGTTRINSDASWKALRQPGIKRDTVASSLQLFPQEHLDLREAPEGWMEPDFDDSNWLAPKERIWNSAPWFALEPRGIPLLEEKEIFPSTLMGIGQGTSASGYAQVRDVVELRQREDWSHHPMEASLRPLSIERTGKGKFRSYLLDFGKTVVGNLVFEIDQATGGEIIDTHLSETIDPASLTPDQVIPTHCRMAFGDRLMARSGHCVHHFYHHYGFRYVMVTVRDAPADFQLEVRLNWIGYPLPRKGSFSSSDTVLERIWEACAWTQQCCSLDAYVDTPWREQAQWWGDARVQAWNTFHLNGDTRLFRRGLAQIARQTTPDGVTYGHAPTMAHECILTDFTIIWMLTLWDYYWQTGSLEPFRAHQKTIKKALAYFQSRIDPHSGLVTADERYWTFLDWTDLLREGAPGVYNLWLLMALEKLALLYRRARWPKEAAPLEAWAGKLRRALGRLLRQDGLMRDGIDKKGKLVRETSIHSQTLALMVGLQGINEKVAFDSLLLPYLRGELEPRAVPSSYWVTYLFSLAAERGHGADVVNFIRKRWLPMADYGTTWENFSPRRGHESHSHAWSAHPLYHLMQIIGGIRQASPAWKEITFSPLFHGDRNRTVVPTPQGEIRTEWHRSNQHIAVELQFPPGMKARVKLPGERPQRIVKSGQWQLRVERLTREP